VRDLFGNFERTFGWGASSDGESGNHWRNGDSPTHFGLGLGLDVDMSAEMGIDYSSMQVVHFEEHLGSPGQLDAYTVVHWESYIEHRSSADIDVEQAEEPVAGN